MADKTTIVVLNIGAQRVGMARFKTKKGQLLLTDYESTEILADPAASASRNAQIKMAVLELAQKLDVKNRVSYAVSGQSVFTRFVRLPDLDGVGKQELVAAEAQQNIPFPLHEVKWDWQEIADIDGESEVIIAAIKSKTLNDIQDAVEGAGMYTTEVDPSPTALYNAFRLSYPDLDEPAMLIDVGAKTSTVIYIDGKRMFCRSIAIGGVSITTAIAKEYNVTFAEAESQKKANGQVALDTRHTSELDELTGALASCIRGALNRMPAEIARTTNYYRSQQGGTAPAKVFVAGGGANLPKISQFLSEKLRLPVENFNPLRAIAIDPKINAEALQEDAHLMGELVGLAARRAGNSGVHLDLVPDSVEKEKDLGRRKSKLFVASGVLVFGLLVFYVFGSMNTSKLKSAEASLDKDLREMEPHAEEMRKIVGSQKAALNDVNTLIKTQQDRVLWVNLLAEIKSEYCSKDYWFTEVQPLLNYKPETNIADLKTRFSATGDNSGPLYSEQNGDLINAVKIRGTWLYNQSEITVKTNKFLEPQEAKTETEDGKVEKSEPKSVYFSKTLKYHDKAGQTGAFKEAPLSVDKMFKIKPQWDESKIGSDFIIILPLKEPILFKAPKEGKK